MKKVSVIMDQSLNEEVSRQLLEESPMDTKSDLIIESAEEGTLSLLKKWPDMKEKLQVCLNQPLPTQLRQVAWRLYLSDTKGRKINVLFDEFSLFINFNFFTNMPNNMF